MVSLGNNVLVRHAAVTRTDDTVVDLVVAASRLTRLAGAIADDDLPRATARALAVLDEHDAVRVSEFARNYGSSQPAATALLGRLVDAGYASRSKDPADSRAVVVALTPAGRERLARVRAAYGTAMTARLADGIDPERLRSAHDVMTELLAALSTPAPRPDPSRTPHP
ncbi:MarR family transcriptional regulator [Nocardia farcinica]|nr:MarR family transcriptional regulator [Nocardia farcinica]PEH78722.1 MarR family transcriptional regulator [Nocardia sp. FDAARGOS_372]MBF6138907.1 MarR family transcriptional regulator [Nocardia farcinica]MBF6187250.1 MarR family transcriptional regulator [Nocardia farcinica]MBF6251908.1 MarR family transcriptional regulator [Nocardia farcinica]